MAKAVRFSAQGIFGIARHGAVIGCVMATGVQPSVAALAIPDTEDRQDGRMELKTPHTSNLDIHQKATASGIERPRTPFPRARPLRWIRLAFLGLPFLGLATLVLAPWLFPGPPVGNFTVTSPNPQEVGERLVGPVLYTLEARAAEQWTFFDFSRGSVVEVPHQFRIDWDLAFQRHKILANGGATNPKGRGAILNLGEVAFEEVLEVPAEGYIEDTIASINPETITTENLAIKAWYHYNFLTHVLHPKSNVYAIRTADGKYVKMRLISYYCDGGQASGCFSIEYVYQGDGSRHFGLTPSIRSELGASR
jgi:HmuY protein